MIYDHRGNQLDGSHRHLGSGLDIRNYGGILFKQNRPLQQRPSCSPARKTAGRTPEVSSSHGDTEPDKDMA